MALLPEIEPAVNPEYKEDAPIDSIESGVPPDEHGLGALDDVSAIAFILVIGNTFAGRRQSICSNPRMA